MFDQYAENFDSDLLENLKYATPTKAYEVFAAKKQPMIDSILDLGCGTGLSILPFQEQCNENTLCVGVDLSRKMIEVARKKNVYTTLIAQSIKEYLETETSHYSLILCLDTLVYIRHLDSIFSRVFAIAEQTFLFSTENTQAKEPTLQRSGRYAHPPHYVENKLKEAGFSHITQQESLLRKDGEHWIEGVIWMAEK